MTIRAMVERGYSEYKDSSKCLVHLDPEIMQRHSLEAGQVILIQTERGRQVAARIGEPLGEDKGRKTVRLNRFMRQGTKTRLNEEVTIERVCSPQNLKKVILKPAIDVSAAHHLVDHIKETLDANQTPVTTGSVLYVNFHDSVAGTTYEVIDTEGDLVGLVGPGTRIEVIYHDAAVGSSTFDVTFEDVGGLEREILLTRELVQLPLQFPHVYRQLGINPPRGVIFYGPPGCGKTYLTRAVANEVRARFYYVNGPSIIGTLYGETEANLRKMFGEAAHHAPSIIFIDELDALAPKRGETGTLSDTRIVTQLMSLMDGLENADGVIVIGTTNRINSIDTALRRPGRFDREIFIGPPDQKGRWEILHINAREMPISEDGLQYLEELAKNTHGFVGADLMELCREAGLNALRRSKSSLRDRLTAWQVEPENIMINKDDFAAARNSIRPSALREALISVPEVTWSDVGGLAKEKKRLQKLIEEPLRNRDSLSKEKTRPANGIVLYGPPGTGKTLLAQVIAHESKVNFLSIKGPEIFTKWLGESEEGIRHVFQVARQLSPCIVFFDQLDALAPSRGQIEGSRTTERVVSQLLLELDCIQGSRDIVVLGATNRVDMIDSSVLRPGRLGAHIYIPLPTAEDRAEIVRIKLRDEELYHSLESIISKLVPLTEGFSGAELTLICEEAKQIAIQSSNLAEIRPLKNEDFQEAYQILLNDRELHKSSFSA